MKSPKPLSNESKQLVQGTPKSGEGILANETKKYKSIEEFNSMNLFHWTTESWLNKFLKTGWKDEAWKLSQHKWITRWGLFTTNDLQLATDYANFSGKRWNIINIELKRIPNVKTFTDFQSAKDYINKWDFGKYDIIEFPETSWDITKYIANKDIIKNTTHFQSFKSPSEAPTLTDIYNQAHSSNPKPLSNESKVIKPTTGNTIPEGSRKNAFGEIIKEPSNKNGGFIRNPFAKPEPKRMFAWENSAQPPSKKTGWFKWADGKMRFEIDDSGAKLKDSNIATVTNEFLKSKFPDKFWKISNYKLEETLNNKDYKELQWLKSSNTQTKVSDYLDHPELFKQYPSLKDVKVSVNEVDYKSDWASYNPNTNTIILYPKYGDKIDKSSLLHEIQHAIQEKEGFARGGSVEGMMKNTKAEELAGKLIELERIWKKNSQEYLNIRKQFDSEKPSISQVEAYDNYKSLAWEVEARNVQTRISLSWKQRTLQSPLSTEDVPRSKQIVRMDSKWPSLLKSEPKNPLVEKAHSKKLTDITPKITPRK